MFKKNKLGIAIVAALAMPASQAHAQDDTVVIDEIIVTATKRERSAQDVPINISAIDEDQLLEGNLFDISRLSQAVPGLNVVDYGAEDTRDIVLRGMNASRLQVLGNSRTTSIYMNDTLIDYTNLDINDVARIEVLRGPQGTLYGGGAVGGTIRYVTNKPDPLEFSGWVETGISDTADAGDLGWQTKAVLNVPLIDDTLALRLFAGYKEVPGFITKIGYPDRPGLPPIRKEDQNSNDRFNARAALRWIMNDKVEVTAAYTGQQLDTKGNSGATPGIGDDFTGAGGIVDESTDESINLYTLDVVADLGFANLTSNTAYFDNHTNHVARDATRFLLELSESIGLYYELFPQLTVNTGFDLITERFTQELRLVSTSDDGFIDYVAGVFYSSEDKKERGNHEETPGLPDFMNQFYFGPGEFSNRPDDFEFVAQLDIDTTEWAVFGEVAFNLTDQWDLVVGGRYFDFDLDGVVPVAFPLFEEILDKFGVPGCSPTQPGTDPTLYPCTLDTSILKNTVNDFVYKINTSYQFENTNALLFLTVAEGFRPGGANFVNSTQADTVDPRFLGFDPDKATSYELGIKSMLRDHRLRLNASIYHIEWEGIQLGTRIGAGFLATVNGDDAKITGFELDVSALLTDDLQLDFSLNMLNAELAEDTLTTPEVDGQKGDRLPGSAEFQAHVALRYETEIANSMNWWLRLAGSYSGDVTAYLNDNQFNQLIDPPELSENRFFDRMPSYTVWNFSTGLTRNQWSVFAYADNLFNEKYIVGSSTFELGPVDDPISRQHYYGRPRTIGVNFRYEL